MWETEAGGLEQHGQLRSRLDYVRPCAKGLKNWKIKIETLKRCCWKSREARQWFRYHGYCGYHSASPSIALQSGSPDFLVCCLIAVAHSSVSLGVAAEQRQPSFWCRSTHQGIPNAHQRHSVWQAPWLQATLGRHYKDPPNSAALGLYLDSLHPSFSFYLGVSQTQHYIICWVGSSVITMATLCIIGYSIVNLAPTYQMPVCLETLLNILQIMMQSCLLYSPQVLIRRAVPVNFLCRKHWISGASQWMGHLINTSIYLSQNYTCIIVIILWTL